MKKLYLLRHAEAPASYELADKDRPLSAHGVNQAKGVSPYLKDINVALCSDAVRTKMTCDAALEGGAQIGKIEYLDTFYNAPAGVLLDGIQAQSTDTLLVIAHNPGIHMLANMLAEDDDSAEIEKLNLYYHPATLSVFDCPIEDWKEIQPRQNKLIDLIIPA